MTISRVRGDYEELAMIAQTLSRQAESTRQTLGALKKNMNTLEGGDWGGKGADAFYAEMNRAVVPAMKRLVAALNEAASTTTKISRIMKRAEDDAAALFKLDGAATSTQAGGNGALGGVDAGVVSAFAPAGPGGAGGGTSGSGYGSGAPVQVAEGPGRKPRRRRPPAKDTSVKHTSLDDMYAQLDPRIKDIPGVTLFLQLGDLQASGWQI